MIYYRFTLIDYTFTAAGDSYTINEPVGFDGFKITLARDADWHGVFTDFTVDGLAIDGVGYDVLDVAYTDAGIEANVILRIEYSCEGCDSDSCYDEIYSAKIDFGRSSRTCGDVCEWNVVLKPESCINELRARYGVKVDMDSLTAFDGAAMDQYGFLSTDISLPSKTILLRSRAETDEQTSDSETTVQQIVIVFAFQKITIEDLNTFSPLPNTYFTTAWDPDPDTDSFFTCEETGDFDISFRIKGNLTISTASLVQCVFRKVDAGGSATDVYVWYEGNAVTNKDIDNNYSATLSLTAGDRLLLYFRSSTDPFLVTYTWEQDTESFIDVQQNSTYAATDAPLYLVHESLSRAAEAITNGCLQVKSNYFGRTDSSPYSFDTDGCGALEAFTNGLLIRRAVMQDGTTPKFTISLKEMFDGLQAIHAVGMGLETDTLTGNEVLTVEPIQDYYTDDIVLTVDNNNLVKTIEEQQHFSKINIGYSKWEAEEYNGLDEFLTQREYRTNLSQTNGQLTQLSEIIASGYAIEITRRKGPSSEDWRYDNDNFIICLKRDDTYAQTFDVEIGNINNPTNIIDPDTVYNFRLSPVRNLLRWLWYVLASYRNAGNVNSTLTFTAGDGNTIASGILDDATCRPEAGILSENETVDITTALDYAPPLWYNERIEFTCPLSFQDFRTIQQNKYGLIAYICNEQTLYGWIARMEYDLTAGEATFILIPKR